MSTSEFSAAALLPEDQVTHSGSLLPLV